MNKLFLAQRLLSRENQDRVFRRVVAPLASMRQEKRFWGLTFAAVSRAQMPLYDASSSPMVPCYRFQGQPQKVAFDFGRFLDLMGHWDPLHPSRRREFWLFTKKFGPLGRHVYEVGRQASPADFPAASVDTNTPSGREILRWLDLAPPEGLIEAESDWDREINALGVALEVLDYCRNGKNFSTAFRPAVMSDGWLADGFEFKPEFFRSDAHASTFHNLLETRDYGEVEVKWMKRYESRKGSLEDAHQSDVFWRYCAWHLLEKTIGLHLEGQVAVEVNLVKNPTKTDVEGGPLLEKVRPTSLAAILWMSLANYINGVTEVHTCQTCGKRYAQTGRQKSRSPEEPNQRNCPQWLSRKCYEAIRRKQKMGRE